MYSANWKPTHQAKCRSYKAQSRAQLWRRQATEDPLHQVRDRWSHVPPKLYSSPSSLHNNPIGMPLHSSPGGEKFQTQLKEDEHWAAVRIYLQCCWTEPLSTATLSPCTLGNDKTEPFRQKKHEALSSISLSFNVNILQWWRERVSCNHHGQLEAFI